jgi:aminoglycoside 3-N-acetyltransferase
MTERNTIEGMEKPNTRTSLREDFKKLGLESGMVVIIHSSLSSLGWVCGGPVAVIQALMDVVGEEGTIVMPTQSSGNSDPSEWQNPPVPIEWWPIIREEMPAFDQETTPTGGMGKIVEAFRSFPGVKRSTHPMYSFAAWGKDADYLLSEQPLEAGFGQKSPLAKIYELNGFILLLGVTHDSNTSLHYAEHAIPNREIVKKSAAITVNGKRVWKEYEEILYNSDPFDELGVDFEKIYPVKYQTIGKATCRLMSQRAIVDFACSWLQK